MQNSDKKYRSTQNIRDKLDRNNDWNRIDVEQVLNIETNHYESMCEEYLNHSMEHKRTNLHLIRFKMHKKRKSTWYTVCQFEKETFEKPTHKFKMIHYKLIQHRKYGYFSESMNRDTPLQNIWKVVKGFANSVSMSVFSHTK